MNTPEPTIHASSAPPRRVLIVDDDEAVRSSLEKLLIAEGYDVVTAVNGIQGLAALRRHPCDLALLDINMPLLNGWGTIGELHRLNRWLPVIIITARPDQRTLAQEAGLEIVEKPFPIPMLLARIEQLLKENGPATAMGTAPAA